MGFESKPMTIKSYSDRIHVDMRDSDSIGVLCRGGSLRHLAEISDKFDKAYLVGQFTNALKKIGPSLEGKQLIQIINKIAWVTDKETCQNFNIQDIQCNFDGWKHRPPSGGRQEFFRRIQKANKWVTAHLLPPGIREARPKGFDWFTTGIMGVDLAAFWKPRHIWIIGLDFYFTPYFVREKFPGKCPLKRRLKMIEMLKLMVKRDPEITFHLVTCYKKIKSFNNLEVTHVEP